MDNLDDELRAMLDVQDVKSEEQRRAKHEADLVRIAEDHEKARAELEANIGSAIGVCGCCETSLALARSITTQDGRTFYECERCGTLQTMHSTLREDFAKRVFELDVGETLTIDPPFRAMRDLPTLARTTIMGEYLLEWDGAHLLMGSLGMKYLNTDRSMNFIKELPSCQTSAETTATG